MNACLFSNIIFFLYIDRTSLPVSLLTVCQASPSAETFCAGRDGFYA
jgi:hypothetical protein